jgi:hypothetical protein
MQLAEQTVVSAAPAHVAGRRQVHMEAQASTILPKGGLETNRYIGAARRSDALASAMHKVIGVLSGYYLGLVPVQA